MKQTLTVKTILLLLLIALPVTLGGASTIFQTAFAATISVNTTTDENNTDGDCSLREAILAANTDNPVDACPTGNGADTINLPAGTYVLAIVGIGEDAALTGDLDITEELTIHGAGKLNTIIDGNGLDRVFHILGSTHILDVTISGGDAGTDQGGGIRVVNALTLTNSRVKENAANAGGGIQVSSNSATLTVIDSRIYNNVATQDGGGIYNFGTATLINSLVSGNTASNGGGISSQQTLLLINSTVSGNDGGVSGGGIKVVDTTDLYNVTITNNEASEGGGVHISLSGTLNAKNSIISDNIDSLPATPDADCSGTLISQGFNLIGDTAGCIIIGTAGNITGVSADLSPLQNNGGPTLTHALQASSLAIDAGDSVDCTDPNGTVLTTDQRGFVRPVDGDGSGNARCDMGAYEYNSPGQPTPTFTPTPTSTHTPSPTITDTPFPTLTDTPGPSPTSTVLPGNSVWVYLPLILR
jgi:CSLREA domain-containing protein